MKNRPAVRSSSSAPKQQSSSTWKVWLPIGCILLGLSGGWWAGRANTDRAENVEVNTASDRVFELKPGPWGHLECTKISIEVPALLLAPENYTDAVHWFFKKHNREEAMTVFRQAGLSPDQLRRLGQDSWWKVEQSGSTVYPTADFVIGLGPESRRAIYNFIGRFPENRAYHTDFLLTAGHFSEITEGNILPPELIGLFKKLVYPEGELMAFNDAPLVLASLPDRASQVNFLKAISRRTTFLLKLKINEQSNIDELVEYWGGGKRAKDLRPLLESLKRVPGGCTIDVAHLVPFFARKRIYTYPTDTGATARYENCHWTALNFFNDPPDNAFLDADRVEHEFRKNYSKVTGNAQLGDLILFREPNGEVVHSATYIAEDVVFTKNGEGVYQPWLFMKATDVIAVYSNVYGRVTATLYRRKDMFYPDGN